MAPVMRLLVFIESSLDDDGRCGTSVTLRPVLDRPQWTWLYKFMTLLPGEVAGERVLRLFLDALFGLGL
jgi:hypothetical protein